MFQAAMGWLKASIPKNMVLAFHQPIGAWDTSAMTRWAGWRQLQNTTSTPCSSILIGWLVALAPRGISHVGHCWHVPGHNGLVEGISTKEHGACLPPAHWGLEHFSNDQLVRNCRIQLAPRNIPTCWSLLTCSRPRWPGWRHQHQRTWCLPSTIPSRSGTHRL